MWEDLSMEEVLWEKGIYHGGGMEFPALVEKLLEIK